MLKINVSETDLFYSTRVLQSVTLKSKSQIEMLVLSISYFASETTSYMRFGIRRVTKLIYIYISCTGEAHYQV